MPGEPTVISSVLVANRGEIACRIFRTCRELGIRTVAVHSDADENALHARVADAAVRLPGTASADTYLRGDAIVKAALAAGADAVHPGYGFLSENAGFARAVIDAGLVWIGPPPAAIEAMASKTRAKQLMGLKPLTDVTETDLPVLVKAAAGGGGRGMRVVRELADLEGELEAARAEAYSAFGDGEVFVEPYVEGGRHVEVQILADTHGTVWTLGTRDCSLQRRHQKVIEESPAPGLSEHLAEEIRELAVRAARAVAYEGAGTVEFLISPDGKAHFLEMNTRLQVEHPVTEAVFGSDLVALQLRVAEGQPLESNPHARVATRWRPVCTPRTRRRPGPRRPAPCTVWRSRSRPTSAWTRGTPTATRSPSTTTRCSPRSSYTPPRARRRSADWPAPWNGRRSTARSPTATSSSAPCATRSSRRPV